jgi:two-component system, chemotaxis family, protein-glutamate methylesterase/glutaminase
MTHYFAKSLDEKSELKIIEAKHDNIIQPSHVYVAPGGQHMAVSRPDSEGQRVITLNSSPPLNSVRPSADILFESIAKSYDGNILAVILTGMGEDGRKGVAQMKKKRCVCISQSAETCVVYGMPRAVDENGLSDESLDPLSITQKIVTMAQ